MTNNISNTKLSCRGEAAYYFVSYAGNVDKSIITHNSSKTAVYVLYYCAITGSLASSETIINKINFYPRSVITNECRMGVRCVLTSNLSLGNAQKVSLYMTETNLNGHSL